MSLEITGVLRAKLAPQQGTSKTGNQWMKQEFVIETKEQYSRKICMNLWGDKADMLNQFNEGDEVTAFFDIESREYNGRWYTDVKAWKLERPQIQMQGVPGNYPPPVGEPMSYASATQDAPTPAPSGTSPNMPVEDTFTDNGMPDDLPF